MIIFDEPIERLKMNTIRSTIKRSGNKYAMIILYDQRHLKLFSDLFYLYEYELNRINVFDIYTTSPYEDEIEVLDENDDIHEKSYKAIAKVNKKYVESLAMEYLETKKIPAIIVLGFISNDARGIVKVIKEINCKTSAEIINVIREIEEKIDLTFDNTSGKYVEGLLEKIQTINLLRNSKKEVVRQKLVEFIKDHMRQNGLTRKKLCELIGIDESTYSRRLKDKVISMKFISSMIKYLRLKENEWAYFMYLCYLISISSTENIDDLAKNIDA